MPAPEIQEDALPVQESSVTPDSPCPTPAQSARKFLASFVTAGVVSYAAKKGLNISVFEQSALTAVVTGGLTYVIPNG